MNVSEMTTEVRQKISAFKSHVLIHDVLAPGFFILSLGGLIAALFMATQSPEAQPQPKAAKEPVHLVSLSRAPIFRANGHKYAVLGLGQDAKSGQQLVWIKSVASGKVSGYREGESLFGTAVTVARIDADQIQVNNLGVHIPVRLAE